MLRSFLLLLLLSTSALAMTDFKVRVVTRIQYGGKSSPDFDDERTEYVQGANRRADVQGFVGITPADLSLPKPHMALISHCETGKGYEVDLDSREYVESKLPQYPSEEEYRKNAEEAKKKAAEKPALPPNLHIEGNTVDTGETRTIFGHTARRFITTYKEIPLEEGVEKEPSERVEDGWYLDVPEPATSCVPDYMLRGHRMVFNTVRSGGAKNNDIRIEAHHTGPDVEGMAVKLTITTKRKIDGKETTGFYEREVVELSEEKLAPALFEVPPGFKKVSRLYQHPAEHARK